jgi:hypothetical protein
MQNEQPFCIFHFAFCIFRIIAPTNCFMRRSFFVLGLVALGLFACQKEINDTIDNNEPTGPDRLLTKYIYSEDTQSWADTFLFDAQNRVIRINEEYRDSSVPAPPYYWFWEMHYNGNDNLPHRVTDTSQGRDMNWYILYDGQKRKTVDSIVYLRSGAKYVTYYTYQGNKVVSKTYSTYGANSNLLTSLDTLVTDGSNWTTYTYVNPLAPGNDYTSQIVYDNNPNPFTTLNITPAIQFGTTFMIGNFMQSGKNNGKTFTYTGMFGAVFQYQYVYDADGYPVSSIFAEQSNPVVMHGAERFVYKQ